MAPEISWNAPSADGVTVSRQFLAQRTPRAQRKGKIRVEGHCCDEDHTALELLINLEPRVDADESQLRPSAPSALKKCLGAKLATVQGSDNPGRSSRAKRNEDFADFRDFGLVWPAGPWYTDHMSGCRLLWRLLVFHPGADPFLASNGDMKASDEHESLVMDATEELQAHVRKVSGPT